MRKWLAGWAGQLSAWFARLADRLWPPYPRRSAIGGGVQGPGPASEDSIPVWLGDPYVHGGCGIHRIRAELEDTDPYRRWPDDSPPSCTPGS